MGFQQSLSIGASRRMRKMKIVFCLSVLFVACLAAPNKGVLLQLKNLLEKTLKADTGSIKVRQIFASSNSFSVVLNDEGPYDRPDGFRMGVRYGVADEDSMADTNYFTLDE